MKNMLSMMSRLLDVGAAATEVTNILKTWVGPLFTALGGVGVIYIVILAVQYAKSENDSKRAEAKTRIMNTLIGVLSLIIMAVVCFAVDWVELVQVFDYMTKKG